MHRNIIRSLLAGAAGALLAVATACSGTSSTAATSGPGSSTSASAGPTFTFGLASDPTGGCDGAQIVQVIPGGNCPILVEEGLVRYDESTNSIAPALATQWQQSGASITFTLRSGVKFQDGTPFNADAVVFNFQRVWDEASPDHKDLVSPYAKNVPIKDVEKVDENTVKVTFTTARPDALLLLTTFPALIQSPTAVQKMGADYTTHAVGTGPYKLVSYEAGQRIELARNDSYWGTKPAAGRVIIVIQKDQSALANSLATHAIDAIVNPTPATIKQLQSSKDISVTSTPALTMFGAYLNTKKAPFDDVRVRQAANFAFDKEALAKLSEGGAKAMDSAFFPGVPGNDPDVASYAFSPDKARALLEQAGWTLPAGGGSVRQKDGKDLAITVISISDQSGVAALEPPIILSNLQDVGFKVTTQVIERANASAMLSASDGWDIAVAGRGSFIPDPTSLLSVFLTSSQPPADVQYARYSSTEYDNALNAAMTELDQTKRQSFLNTAQETLRTDAPFLWMVQVQSQVAFDATKISAAPFRVFGQLDVANVTFR